MSPDTKTGVLTPGSGRILHHDQRALGAQANRTRDGGLTSADEGASGSCGSDVRDFAAEALILDVVFVVILVTATLGPIMTQRYAP
jgi:hypothetical protein